ncbi:hypothetical protein HPB52_016830 [Rhipicephalus sanguineus]|uniref:FH2 domain-containing protein n=1 Tax=Rhipicephalus sanguineus TaxID=34632 RepID=A0A9D4Q7H7_RHISA|nr:hypothetical protein HPB52_016830 [Rhipicephalus sanguineus]
MECKIESVRISVYDKPQSVAFLVLLRNFEKLDPDDTASHLAWELLERLSQQLSSGPVQPLYNAMGPKLTPPPPVLAAMEKLDNGYSRHRGGSEGDTEVFADRSPPPPKNRLNIFKLFTQGWKKSPTRGDTDAHASGLSRSTSYRSKSSQARRSSQTSPVLRQNQEVIGVKRFPNSTRVTRRSVEASPPRSPPQRSSPRSTQLTRSSVLRSSTDGQQPAVAAACKTSPEIRRRQDVKDTGHPPVPPAPSEPQGLKGVQSANGGMQSPHGDGLATKITPSKAAQPKAAPRGPVSPGPFHTLPKPQQKMKTLNWTKVPDTLVCGGKSIWSDVTKEAQEENVERKLNFKQVEELFCQKTATTVQPKVSPEKKKREPAFLSLLDGKRSLNVCIFLKQFKSGPEQIVSMIRSCKSKEIGAERLRMLQKILPEPGELSMLRSYTGDRSKLGQAEQFFLMLGDLRLHALYVDGMLQMEEFRPSVDVLKPQLDNYIGVCQEILTNRSLKEFLKLILITGNFINSTAKAQLSELSSSFDKIGELSRRLAEHFCEEESRFSVEECLHIFNNFCEKVKLAKKENEERRLLEERAEKLKITRMSTEQSKPRHAKKPTSSFVEEDCLVDRLLAEIRQGSFKLRKTPA